MDPEFERDAIELEANAYALTRRSVLLGMGGIGALGVLGIPLTPSGAAHAADRTLTAVLEEARGFGSTPNLHWNSGAWYTYGAPSGFNAPWCAQFVSYLLRGNMPRRTIVSDPPPSIRSYYEPQGRFGHVPTVGSIVIYADPGHTGLIESVRSGVAIPIEGNAGSGSYTENVVKWRDGVHNSSYGVYEHPPLGYCYPLYNGYDSMTGAGSPGGAQGDGIDMTDLIYYADTTQGPRYSSGGITVELESMWYQECPGAPLFALTGGLAYTATAAMYEYGAFQSTRSVVQAKRFACTAAQIAALIQLRGTTTRPTGNFV